MAAPESKVMLNGTLKRLVASSVLSEEDAKEATVTAKKRKIPLFTFRTIQAPKAILDVILRHENLCILIRLSKCIDDAT